MNRQNSFTLTYINIGVGDHPNRKRQKKTNFTPNLNDLKLK